MHCDPSREGQSSGQPVPIDRDTRGTVKLLGVEEVGINCIPMTVTLGKKRISARLA